MARRRLKRGWLLLLVLPIGPWANSAQAASYKVGSFAKTIAGAPTPQVVPHGLGVTPKALILWTNGKTNESFGAGARFALGFSDGTSSASVANGLEDARATPLLYASNGGRTAAITIVDGATMGTVAEATLGSWDATNFTLNWSINDASPYVVHFLAIGGSEVSAKVVQWNRAITTGGQSVTGVGFRPDVVFHLEADMQSPTNNQEGVVSLGVMDAAGGQWANSVFSFQFPNPQTATQRAQSASSCFYWAYNNDIAHEASFVSMDADGFTVDHTDNDGYDGLIFSLALKGIRARAGSFTKTTAAATAAQVVTAGLRPRAVLLSSVQNVTATGFVTEARHGFGASDGTSEGSSAFQDQHLVGPSNVDGIDKTSKVFVKLDNATPAIDAEADLASLDENGFTLSWTTNDAVATEILYLALAEATDLTQAHYRWRNDDGAEDTATWAAGQDALLPGLPEGVKRRLRFEVSNEGVGTATASYELQVAQTGTCATGSYAAVPTDASGHWQVVDSTFLTDGDPTTNVSGGLTDEATTFVAGQVKDLGNTTGSVTLNTDAFSELEFGLQATANATDGASYCFRLYDATHGRTLDTHSVYAQATVQGTMLTLAGHPAGQVADQLTTSSPVTTTLFRFGLIRSGTVTVDALRVRFSTGGGVANGDVTAGELWLDTNGNGAVDGGDTLVQGATTPAAGVFSFTTDFTAATSGTAYLLRTTVANLAPGDTTTFLLGLADIDEVEAGVAESGSVASATHTQDGLSGGDVYYSVGTSSANLRTGAPTMTIAGGLATLSVAQTGNVGVGDLITYNTTLKVYIKAVLSQTEFAVQIATGGLPLDTAGASVDSIARAFGTIANAESQSTDVSHLDTTDLVAGGYRLTWVCYNDGLLNVTTNTTIAGYTTDATHYVTLTVAGAAEVASGISQRHAGRAATGAVVEVGAGSLPNGVLYVNQAYTRVEWLEIDGNSFVGHDGISVGTSGTGALLRNLLIHDIGTAHASCPTSPTSCSGIKIEASAVGVRNSMIYDYGQDGIDVLAAGATIANVTIFRSRATGDVGEGLQVGAAPATATAENVIAMGNGPDFLVDVGGALTCNNCLSADDSADNYSGAANQINRAAASQFASITTSFVDLHLKPGADALDGGKNLSATFADDVEAQARPQGAAWDMGADEAGQTPRLVVRSGTYTGDGNDDRAIFVGFQPDIVIVDWIGDGVTTQNRQAVVRAANMPADGSRDLDGTADALGGITPPSNKIQSFGASGFTIGNDVDVNENNQAYHWVAIQAVAPGTLKLGSYVGDNTPARTIAGIGFAPAYVLVMPVQFNRSVIQRSATMPARYSENFQATGFNDPTGTNAAVTAFHSDGFTIGGSATVNEDGFSYYYAAFAMAPGSLAVGTYIGDGAARDITGTGFWPEWALVSRADSTGMAGNHVNSPTHRPASMGFATDKSLLLNSNTGAESLNIVALQADGFRVGTHVRVNATTEPYAYYWLALGPHVPQIHYRSIGNAADLSGGTIHATANSTYVTRTGGGTGWQAANRGRGDRLTVNGQHYVVAAVASDNELILASPAVATYDGTSYTIARQFQDLQKWENCVSREAVNYPCAYDSTSGPVEYFPSVSASLVADDRSEVGIAYEEGSGLGVPGTFRAVAIDGSTTDATHTITLTADGSNRHYGLPGTGVVLDNAAVADTAVKVQDDYVTVEWLEIRGGGSGGHGILIDGIAPGSGTTGASRILLRNNLIHVSTDYGIVTIDDDPIADIYDNIVYSGSTGIRIANATLATWARVRLLNNTIYDSSSSGIDSSVGCCSGTGTEQLTVSNNISALGSNRFALWGFNSASGNNLSTDGGAPGYPGSGLISQDIDTQVLFANRTGGDLHITGSSTARNAGADLSASFRTDVDNQARTLTWDIGADEFDGFTPVKLASFSARGLEGAVRVEWETASELDNLGFHLYRAPAPDGPWTRLNSSLIPGLGSSPEGKRYAWTDTSLANGSTYFYRLEDVDRRGKLTSHGPVSATPQAGAQPADGGDGDGGETTKPGASWTSHGEPEMQSLRILERSSSGLTLELVTGGFYSYAQADGTTQLFIPGFFDHSEPGRPIVPTRRLWQDVLVGRGARIVSVEPFDSVRFSGLRVSLAGRPVAVATPGGTYEARSIPLSRAQARKARARDAASGGTPFPSSLARIHEIAFQGETKKAYLELAPLQIDETSGELRLARRLLVRLSFGGRVRGERGRGRLGRRPRDGDAPDATPRVLARLATRERGLHAVAFEELPGLRRALSTSSLRLSRLGSSVAFHVEPDDRRFGPGSTLFFLGEGTDSAHANEAVYELGLGKGGAPMPVASTRGSSEIPLTHLRLEAAFEKDGQYLPALTEARDLWTWDYGLPSGQGQDYPFALDEPLLTPETARLRVDLEGGSDTPAEEDHHVLAFVNGSLVGEVRFDGRRPATLEADVQTSLLRDGENTLRLENAGDTGSTVSFVYLDRFTVEYPRPLVPIAGALEGTASETGRASLSAPPGSILLDTTDATPRFLNRTRIPRLAWNAEAGHRYLAVFPEAFGKVDVRPAPRASLRSASRRADWIAIAPKALLPAAQTLAAHRGAQGLAAIAVSLEDVVDQFGFGEGGPHAVQSFLAFAFHHWQAPSPRYVLLLGDASYDPKGRLAATSRPDLVPTPYTKSTFLWAPSDPLYAAVNGEDGVPDIAVGRASAASLEEANVVVRKILDFESSHITLSGKAALVADNPDAAGDFELDQDKVASLLASRPVQKIYLTHYPSPALAKAAVLEAFDSGASLVSYVGHGSAGLWASEGLLRSLDVQTLAPQPRQPLVLTMTCSNGFFVSPYSNSLAETLVLADEKGAIAAFSPAGLSSNAAAHVFHEALVSELEQGTHDRLGDLVLAAQSTYATTGAFPELLALYHLFGDPALRIQ